MKNDAFADKGKVYVFIQENNASNEEIVGLWLLPSRNQVPRKLFFITGTLEMTAAQVNLVTTKIIVMQAKKQKTPKFVHQIDNKSL